ncbi:hypothetical protein U9M48_009759 [Paspalum notatum var. saurae]|uniref:Uncharacterized protein n=1 Tax=Paspalum notatum var. saurae TaxID=547442 RepID=A0AAQ3SS95_PASNO
MPAALHGPKRTKLTLTGIEGLSEAKVDKIWEAAEKLLNQGFMAESDLLLKKSVGTGSQEVDESMMGTEEGFLVKHFPDRKTFMKKNYELKPQQITQIIFHIISKAALWIVLAVLWFIVIVLKIVINLFALLKSALGSLSSNQENSLKTGLIRRNHGNRTGDRKSSNV